MRRALTTVILVAALCLLASSCADLEAETPAVPGALARDATVNLSDSIPAEFGDLVAVTTTEIYPDYAQLWFQKEDGAIVTVFLNYKRGVMEKHPLVIPRS